MRRDDTVMRRRLPAEMRKFLFKFPSITAVLLFQ